MFPPAAIKSDGQIQEKNGQGDEVAKVVQPGAQVGKAEGQARDLAVAAVEDRDELEQQPGGQGVAVTAAADQPAAEQAQRQVGHGDLVRTDPQADEQTADGPGNAAVQVAREKSVAGLAQGTPQQAPRLLLALPGIHLAPSRGPHRKRRRGGEEGGEVPHAGFFAADRGRRRGNIPPGKRPVPKSRVRSGLVSGGETRRRSSSTSSIWRRPGQGGGETRAVRPGAGTGLPAAAVPPLRHRPAARRSPGRPRRHLPRKRPAGTPLLPAPAPGCARCRRGPGSGPSAAAGRARAAGGRDRPFRGCRPGPQARPG